MRGPYAVISLRGMEFPEVLFDCLAHDHTTRLDEWESRTYEVRDGEEFELATEDTVVAFFGFFHHRVVGIEFRLGVKSEAIDTRELLVLGITSPVCTRYLVEFEAIFWYLGSELDMRPLTHIDKSRSRELTEIRKIHVYRILELPDIGIKADNRLSLRCKILDHLVLVVFTERLGKSLRISD